MKTGVILWWLPSASKWTTFENLEGAQAPSFFAFPPCVAQVSGDTFSYSYNRTGIKFQIDGVTTGSLTGYGKGVGNLGAPVATDDTIPPQPIKIEGTEKTQYYQSSELQTDPETDQPFIEIEGSVMTFIFQRPLRLSRP